MMLDTYQRLETNLVTFVLVIIAYMYKVDREVIPLLKTINMFSCATEPNKNMSFVKSNVSICPIY